MDIEVEAAPSGNLVRLQWYLDLEISGSIMYMLSFFTMRFSGFFTFIIIMLATIAALLFTPYMLYVLFLEKKRGWIILFVIIVIIPNALLIAGTFLFDLTKALLVTFPGLFYLYFFLLRFEVSDWVRERRAKNQYLLVKKREEEERKFNEENYIKY